MKTSIDVRQARTLTELGLDAVACSTIPGLLETLGVDNGREIEIYNWGCFWRVTLTVAGYRHTSSGHAMIDALFNLLVAVAHEKPIFLIKI